MFIQRRPAAGPVRGRKRTLLLGAAAGGLLAFFFDPEHGPARRAVVADRLSGFARRGAQEVDRLRRRVLDERVWRKLVQLRPPTPTAAEVTWAPRVETERPPAGTASEHQAQAREAE